MTNAKTPQQILADLRQRDPLIAKAMADTSREKLENLSKLFEQYMANIMNAVAILSVIGVDEAKAPEELEDAKKAASVAHAAVVSLHGLIEMMPPPIRVVATDNFMRGFDGFMRENSVKIAGEIQKSITKRHEMLDRLRAGAREVQIP